MNYNLSKYNFIFQKKEYTILYNLLSKAILKLNGNFTYNDILSVANEDAQILETLKTNSILVDKSINENKLAYKRLKLYSKSTKNLSLVIHLTTNCNCNCFYCYEKGIYTKNDVFTKYDEYEEFIKKYQNIYKCENLEISFHGGEPTLYPETMIKLFNISKKYFTNVNSTIVTNGTLIAKNKLINVFKDVNMTNVLITIDGPKEVHDARRPYRNNKYSPFNDIMASLEILNKKKIHVHISMIIDKKNYNYLDKWYQQIIKKYSNSTFYIAKVESGYKNTLDSLLTSKEFMQIKIDFYKRNNIKMSENGKISTQLLSDNVCSLKRGNEIIIGANGDIYKCISLTGLKKFCVGNLKDDTIDLLDKLNNYIFNIMDPECYDCKFFPICFGGCLLEKETKHRNFNNCHHKKFYEKHIENIILNSIDSI